MTLENLEKLPELVFEYSAESELTRVRNVFERKDFFRENKYRITLPEGITLDGSLNEEVVGKIHREINIEKVRKIEEEIKLTWPDIIKRIRTVATEIEYRLPEKYTLILSRYGTGGSYRAKENSIVLNIENPAYFDNSPQHTIAHEIFHIAIQHLIEKYNIKHWVKERIVDLMMQKIYPDDKKQKISLTQEEIQATDQIFDQYYPNIEKILEEINKQIYDK